MKYRVFISDKEQTLCNLRLPKNAILIVDEYGDATLCMNFPRNYKGSDPVLHIYYWDEIHQCFVPDVWKNATTKALWTIYARGGYKRMGKIMYPQIAQVIKQVPHNTKIGHVQSSVMCDPEKKRRNEYTTTDYACCKPGVYRYYSSIGTYGKAGDSMRL